MWPKVFENRLVNIVRIALEKQWWSLRFDSKFGHIFLIQERYTTLFRVEINVLRVIVFTKWNHTIFEIVWIYFTISRKRIILAKFITSLAIVCSVQEFELLFEIIYLKLLTVKIKLFFIILILHVSVKVDVVRRKTIRWSSVVYVVLTDFIRFILIWNRWFIFFKFILIVHTSAYWWWSVSHCARRLCLFYSWTWNLFKRATFFFNLIIRRPSFEQRFSIYFLVPVRNVWILIFLPTIDSRFPLCFNFFHFLFRNNCCFSFTLEKWTRWTIRLLLLIRWFLIFIHLTFI
jgi:hypothetical protein